MGNIAVLGGGGTPSNRKMLYLLFVNQDNTAMLGWNGYHAVLCLAVNNTLFWHTLLSVTSQYMSYTVRL